MHYYKFNIADYRKDTTHLTPIEHYIYRSLIDWYYLDEHPIPKETQSVIRRLSLGSDMVNLVQNVLADFFDLTEKGYVHNRIEVDILEFHAKAGKNKENGKLGGRPAKPIITKNKTQSVNSDNPNQSEPNLNHKPLTNNHKPIKYIPPIPAELLSEWLAIRKRKPVTERVFNALVKEANKLGWTAEQAVIKCCEKTWAGFEAAWVTKDNKPSYQDAREAAARTAFGSLLTNQNNLKVINNE